MHRHLQARRLRVDGNDQGRAADARALQDIQAHTAAAQHNHRRSRLDLRGNLFAAGIPINLDRAISDGAVKNGDVVMMAAFAHAGDFAGAAAVKWGGR